MDMITLLGLLVGVGGIIGGMLFEGGHLSSIMQGTAAVIVFGGTAGAVLISTTREDLKTGLRLFKWAFSEPNNDESGKLVAEIIDAAQTARKESILALEKKINSFSHPFMQNVFRLVIDGVDPHTLRDVFEAEIEKEEEALNAGAKIYVDAGGYSPTIGIIGAVLGLIHVMQNVSDTSALAAGIAVAFVATVYGVGSANLFFLPVGAKIKRRIQKQSEVKQLILEGAIGILNGMSPFVIQEKLNAFSGHEPELDFKKAA
ncbi:MAG: flagellar motor protein [Bdellovibrionaceae bacterium]|nr:flagellar motor protein [Pseudobdellovibrionaceae bacterium]